MKNMHIVNIFGKIFNRKSENASMVIKRKDGIVIYIPEKAIKASGIIKDAVAKRLAPLTIENIQWLEENYGVEFTLDADKAIA